MSENIMRGTGMLQDDASYSTYFAEDIKKAVSEQGKKEFSDAKAYWKKLGLNITLTEKEMMNEIVKTASKYLTKGLLQLTIEEITSEKECQDALSEKKGRTVVMRLSRTLSPLKIYSELIIKCGSIELKKFRFDFKAEPKVEIEDIDVTIQNKRVKSVSFGSFKASITLSLLKGEIAMKIASIEKSLNLSGPIYI